MAKPGSDDARRLARAAAGARDLSRAGMSPQESAEAQEVMEIMNGLRCGGCGRRIGAGFHFTSIAPREAQPILKLSACSRDDCDYAEKCRHGGTFIEVCEYVWIDEHGIDAPPARRIVEGNRKAAEGKAAQNGKPPDE